MPKILGQKWFPRLLYRFFLGEIHVKGPTRPPERGTINFRRWSRMTTIFNRISFVTNRNRRSFGKGLEIDCPVPLSPGNHCMISRNKFLGLRKHRKTCVSPNLDFRIFTFKCNEITTGNATGNISTWKIKMARPICGILPEKLLIVMYWRLLIRLGLGWDQNQAVRGYPCQEACEKNDPMH